MKNAVLTLAVCFFFSAVQSVFAQGLTKPALRDIDGLAVKLVDYAKELHDEYHEHLAGVRHAEKLDEDVTSLERIAEALHDFVHDADQSENSMRRIRADANEFLQLAIRITRTIDLTDPWLRHHDARRGIRHMRDAVKDVLRVAHQIDAYLPVDPQVIDDQAARLEAAVKELHDEYHEHLEGYEVSRHLDEDLESLETLVEHLHDLAHGGSWAQLDLRHVADDIREVRRRTDHIEELFVRQSRIGVRTSDWIGIEHSRDAITDVLASAYLLDHMIDKTIRPAGRDNIRDDFDRNGHRRPRRDRIRDDRDRDIRHRDHN